MNFFKISQSRYIQQLSAKSYGFANLLPLMHFVYIDSNSITNIIATYEPQVHYITDEVNALGDAT